MRKKIAIAIMLLAVVLLMAGCQEYYQTPLHGPGADPDPGLWTQYIVAPLSAVLVFFTELFSGSYGLSIVVVTLLIRLALLPLMIKQTKSSKAMQDIQPQMKELREKYSSKDQKTQRKLQEETMKLFQENNVNPMAGCLPVIVQMPILIAFYQAIYKIEAGIESGYSGYAGMQPDFLWFTLSNPDHILPIIAALATFVQQKLMMGRTGNTNPQMAMMMYLMPIMIGIFGQFLPSALSLYWVVGNCFMILQIFIIYNKPSSKKEPEQTGGSKS